MSRANPAKTDLTQTPYRQIAEFRYQVRKFLHFSEESARASGVEPQQHQLMLAIKGMEAGMRPTIKALAERLFLRHHSTVELVNRMVLLGLVVRRQSEEDRREVLVEMTKQGEELLQQLSRLHWEELQTAGPALAEALNKIVR